MQNAIDFIRQERVRQIEEEGWTAEHDDQHAPGVLSMAAISYLFQYYGIPRIAREWWPFSMRWWKPSDPLRNLRKAGALVAAEMDRHLRVLGHAPTYRAKRRIVCLCGSTRFWREFQKAGLEETLAGHIVLSIGAASGTDDDHFGNLPQEEYDRVKAELDGLHLDKIDMADEVLILNVGGYMGESTSREFHHAFQQGKVIRFLEPDNIPEWAWRLLAEGSFVKAESAEKTP